MKPSPLIPPPTPWYPAEMWVKKRLFRKPRNQLYWYWAKRFYTTLHGPGGIHRRAAALCRRLAARRLMITFPDWPSVDSELYKICAVLNLRLTQDTSASATAAIFFHDRTRHEPDTQIRALAERQKVINLHCHDISKTRVEEVFRQVFGYGTFVDPATFTGPCVAKSEINARHDGRIIQCPTPREPDTVYQRVIDNTRHNGTIIVDHRCPVFRGEMPFVYLKHREPSVRFVDQNSMVTISRPEELFSPEEREKIRLFCETLRLDYGGLDILRDRADGRIYIVDANKTPYGPPKATTFCQEDWALSRLAAAFEKAFLG